MQGRIFGLAATFLMLAIAPAWAQAVCREPIVPPAIDGNTATAPQMKVQLQDVKTFLTASDDYQDCLIKSLDAAAAAAQKANTDIDPRLEAALETKLQSNQLLKERVGALFNAAVAAYKARNPG